ncbi:hypothetical protein SNL152K_2333 [Streptomyces sp. NL15-2K]|nr:hypothetical protein SNL152K_2333 [Streptomyces sp. NL15-2K]
MIERAGHEEHFDEERENGPCYGTGTSVGAGRATAPASKRERRSRREPCRAP